MGWQPCNRVVPAAAVCRAWPVGRLTPGSPLPCVGLRRFLVRRQVAQVSASGVAQMLQYYSSEEAVAGMDASASGNGAGTDAAGNCNCMWHNAALRPPALASPSKLRTVHTVTVSHRLLYAATARNIKGWLLIAPAVT